MGIIYKITNDINDKVYIGQTTNPLEKRWYDHQYSARNPREDNDNVLYRAMRKYGIGHFSISTIEQVDDSLLDEREIYWIEVYNSYNPNGYNSTLGGKGHTKYDHSEVIDYYLTVARRNGAETAKHFGCNQGTITNIIHSAGYNGAISRNLVGQGIYKIDPNSGDVIAYYASVGIATKMDGYTITGIGSVLCNNSKTYKGYYWIYKNQYNPSKDYRIVDNRKKKVLCIEEDISFSSRSDAARWLIENKYSQDNPKGVSSNIGRAIRTSIRAYGFHWKEI